MKARENKSRCKIKRIFILKYIIFASLLFFFSQTVFFSQEMQIKPTEYRIGPRDLLEINVIGIEEFPQTVRVLEDGKITLPLLGDVEVEGLTEAGLQKKLVELLKEKYLQDPQVTVFIQEHQSKRVSIMGAVGVPGTYELLGRQTLLQIIVQAGGISQEAGDNIILMRRLENGGSKSIKIPIHELLFEGDETLDIPLEPDDIINVPIDKIVYIHIWGQVRNPGLLEVKKSRIPTITEAIARAGGFAERASKGKVLLITTDEKGNKKRIKVNIKDILKGKRKDIQLKENDQVHVSETLF